jgi:hypothetical protein
VHQEHVYDIYKYDEQVEKGLYRSEKASLGPDCMHLLLDFLDEVLLDLDLGTVLGPHA